MQRLATDNDKLTDAQDQLILDMPASQLRDAGTLSRLNPSSLPAVFRPLATDMAAMALLSEEAVSARTGLSCEQIKAWFGR